MKSKTLGTLLSMVLLTGCNSWKSTLVADGDENDAIMNAITDFIHTCNLRNKDTIFVINKWIDNDTFLVIGISGTDENKLYPQKKQDTIGGYPYRLPSRYVVIDGKLFYWEDKSIKVSKEIVNVLSEFNAIDSLNYDSLVIFNPYVIIESKKAAHYHFCKNNIKEYKKNISKYAVEWYDPPKLKCGYPFKMRDVSPRKIKK